jgi:transcriptional/translational regulatory protein YebC/TACO1
MTNADDIRLTEDVRTLQAVVRAINKILEDVREDSDGPDHYFQIFANPDDFHALEAALEAAQQSA